MAGIFWKAVAALAFIGVMTGLRFGLSWSFDAMNQQFAEGLIVGALGVLAVLALVDQLERRGWL